MSTRRVWVLATAVVCGAAASPLLAGPAEAAVTCGGERATIVGTAAGDTLTGTSGDDVIVGAPGSDTIMGLGGRDVICGGQGSDRLSGGPGRDRVYGGFDAKRLLTGKGMFLIGDDLSGGAGDDRLFPGFDTRRADGRSRDSLSWATSARPVRIDLARGMAVGDGHDTFATTPVQVYGSDFSDVIDGSRRPDGIIAGLGSDRIDAGAGDDDIDIDSAVSSEPPADQPNADLVHAGAGNDTIDARKGADRLYGGDGHDAVYAFHVSLHGGQSQIFAGSGDDHVISNLVFTTHQVISAGPGVDFFTLADYLANPLHHPATGTFDMATGQMTYQVDAQQVDLAVPGFEGFSFIEEDKTASRWQVRGTTSNDRVDARDTNGTTFEALGGNDVMWGSDGDDQFDGGPGNDTAHAMGLGNNACRHVERFPDGPCATTSP